MSNSKTYEGMFLVQSGSDFHAASQPVNTVLERSDAEVLSINPWEERRLAYEIKGHKRGLYILTYFKMDPEKLSELHRDSELNEGILRMMILHREKLSDEEINADTPARVSHRQAAASEAAAEATAAQAAAEPPPPEEAPVEDAAALDVPAVEEAPAAEADVIADAPVVEEAPAVEEEAPAEADTPADEEAPLEASFEEEAPIESEVVEPGGEPQDATDEVDEDEAEPKASDEA